ncbi:MAG: LacI family DNA-binding transcriptional regulator [Blautia sp.]|nr:LacI family transcriptional regulator [Blautia sp.]MDY3998096.1 LacI family DNA-binding transcriptional regulator [Blautia sp.]
MGVTIKDVAKEADVAISTVSKYLNGGSVRRENKKAIEKAIRKLNYSPNSVARGLRTSRTYRVGLVTGSGDNPHMAALLDEIERQLWKEGYSLIYLNTECCDEAAVREYVNFIAETGVDGIIVTASGNSGDCLQRARDYEIPVVVMEECYTDVPTDCIQVDCAGGSYQAVEYLVNAGHRKIAAVCGPEKQMTAAERRRGYLRVMEDYGLPVSRENMPDGCFKYEGGYESIKKIWELPDRPTAVFITNYQMCMGAMEAVFELGIRVPEELSIVTFDDFELSVMVRPKLTAVRQPLKELSDEVCRTLIRRINGDYDDFPRKVRLKPSFIERDSVLRIPP